MNPGISAGTHSLRIDFRLVPAALAVWAVTLLGLLYGWIPMAVTSLMACVAATVLWLTARSRRWANGVLAVLAMASVAGAGMGARTYQLGTHPLRIAAEHGERATLRLTLGGQPRPLHGVSYGARKAEDRSIVHAELRHADVSGHRLRGGGGVLLLVPTAQWRGLIAGQSLTVRGKVAPPRSGEPLVAVLQAYQTPEQVTSAPGWQRVAEDLREGLRRTAAKVLAPEAAGLLPGLVVGDTTALPPETVREFETAGLTHLTAVSGANLAIVCGAVLVLLHLVGMGPVLSAAGAGLALVGFVVLAGPEPSVLRAAVMGAITLLALVLGRSHSALPALAASVIGLLLVMPALATAVGFALSVAATAGLVLLAPSWAAGLRARGVPTGLAETLAVPAAAQVVTAPLVASISGEISLVAVAANVLAGPLVAPATVLGVLATAVGPAFTWLADAAVWLAGPELEWVLAVARHAAGVPGATLGWPSGSGGGLLLAAVSIVVLIALRGRRMRWVAVALVLVACIVVVPGNVLSSRWPESGWSMVVCDVGQGDGLVLATGNPGEAVLVDTGPDPERTGECLRRLGVRRVPLIVLTHLHADHVGGLSAVLADHAVAAVAVGPLHEPGWAMDEITRDARGNSVPIVPLSAGQSVRWPSLVLDVLGPMGSLARTTSADDANDASVVLRASTPAGRILLTGDIELSGQAQLLAAGADLRADILKIPHHGSRYTTPRFLRAVRPRLALVSVGEGNSYGHPSPLVLGELTRAGAKVLRTDTEGDIAVLGGRSGPRTLSRGDPVRADDR